METRYLPTMHLLCEVYSYTKKIISSSTDFNNVMILKLLINDVSSFKRIFIEGHRYVNILILFYFLNRDL